MVNNKSLAVIIMRRNYRHEIFHDEITKQQNYNEVIATTKLSRLNYRTPLRGQLEI